MNIYTLARHIQTLYHTSSDSFGSVNMDLVKRVAQMTVASVARFTGAILAAVDGGALASGIPASAGLSQNYSNPFNPATVVRYQFPSACEVRLTVYDLLGREVTTLVDGMQAAGIHTVTFNAAGLSSGTYLYRLNAGGFRRAGR